MFFGDSVHSRHTLPGTLTSCDLMFFGDSVHSLKMLRGLMAVVI